MSTLRTNEIRDLNNNLLWDAEQGVGGASVNTSTGTQTVAEALDSRAVLFTSIDDLKSSETLSVGTRVRTLSYLPPLFLSDFPYAGGCYYDIVEAGTGADDGGSFINLPGSGHQARAIFPETITPAFFGARGNGTDGVAGRDSAQDDTSALQAWFEYMLSTDHYDLDLGGKIYTISAPITCNGLQVSKRHMHNGRLWARSDFTGGAMLDLTSAPGSFGVNGFTISKMVFNGGALGQIAEASHGILIGECQGVHIEGVELWRFTDCALEVLNEGPGVELSVAGTLITGGKADNTNVVGIRVHGFDCRIHSETIVRGCRDNVEFIRGGGSVTDCHLYDPERFNFISRDCSGLQFNDNYVDNGPVLLINPRNSQMNDNKFLINSSTVANSFVSNGYGYMMLRPNGTGIVVDNFQAKGNNFFNASAVQVDMFVHNSLAGSAFSATIRRSFINENSGSGSVTMYSTHPEATVSLQDLATDRVEIDWDSSDANIRSLPDPWGIALCTGAMLTTSEDRALNRAIRSGNTSIIVFDATINSGFVHAKATVNEERM